MRVSRLSAEIKVDEGESFADFARELIALAKKNGVSVTAEWLSYGNFIKITARPDSTLDDLERQKHGGKTS